MAIANNGAGTFVWTDSFPAHNPGASGAKFAVNRDTYIKYRWVTGTTWEVDYPSLPETQVAFGSTDNLITSNADLVYFALLRFLGIGVASPTARIELLGTLNAVAPQYVNPLPSIGNCDAWTLAGGFTCAPPLRAKGVGATAIAQTSHQGVGTLHLNYNGPMVLGQLRVSSGATTIDLPTQAMIDENETSLSFPGFTFGPILTFESLTKEEIEITYLEGEYITPQVETTPFLKVKSLLGTGYDLEFVGGNEGLSTHGTLLKSGGLGNIALGAEALRELVSGDYNVAIGRGAFKSTDNLTNMVAVGYRVAELAGSSNSGVVIGANAARNASYFNSSVLIGAGAGELAAFVTGMIAIGLNAARKNTENAIVIGNGSLIGATNAANVVVIGNGSGNGANMTAGGAVIIGMESGNALTTGTSNVIIGLGSGNALTTGFTNVLIGGSCGNNLIGGFSNVFIGAVAGGGCINGSQNMYLGRETGTANASGSQNTYIGYRAGRLSASGSRQVFIGNQAGENTSGDDKLMIDSSPTTSPLVGGNFASRRVGINAPVDGLTSTLHVVGANGHSQFRLATSYTPTGTSDPNGQVGDIAWDDNYHYIKTTIGWKRSDLSTF